MDPEKGSQPNPTVTMRAATERSSHHSAPATDLFQARFLPGTILGQRYRIVNLLGKGGMGEVYRAMDLTLGQTVALKFLPDEVAHQAAARERLFHEVRVAREITHPQVCRVHDIGEIDGQLYISMEFVDGEDLASLLSRIGRLPAGKAGELAAGICAGLAAAHRSGLIHRDLKPANIMVDGRGQPRLMDFGLAASAGNVAQGDVRSGTPMYMAPEQLAGKEVTIRSDLYALGLILYELFTGQRPFEGKSREALLAARERNEPNLISTLCPDVTPAVESAIAACLSPDPARRPASAHAVAAAMPYRDALAAVMAAGDTPSPELIAASGDTKALKPAVAYGAGAAILAGLVGIFFLRSLTGEAPEQPPEVLAHSARTLAAQLGYTATPAGTVYGFVRAGSPTRREIRFWYRESDAELQPAVNGNFLSAPGRVTPSDPPLAPGMRLLEMNARGRLIGLSAIPQFAPAVNSQVDWKALFESAGLDLSRFTPAPPVARPPVAADTALRWTGQSVPDGPQLAVAAASWMGQAVYFQVSNADEGGTPLLRSQDGIAPAVALVLMGAMLAAGFLARRNLQQNRGDRKGAFRVGAAMFWICAAEWVLVARHSFTVREAVAAAFGLSWALAMGTLAYLGYIAIDPTLRRIYPEALVSLQKLLTGGRRDAVLGRDILCGLGIAIVISFASRNLGLFGGRSASPEEGLTLRALAGIWLGDLRLGAWVGLFFLTLMTRVFGWRRNRQMRFGALGVVIAETGLFCLRDMPSVPDVSAWYAQAPLLGYAAFGLLAIYAVRLAVGKSPGMGGATQV